jgi:hypothetical protein
MRRQKYGYAYTTAALIPTAKSPVEALNAEARKNPGWHDAYIFESLKANWYAFCAAD